jgi:hypothetical protein
VPLLLMPASRFSKSPEPIVLIVRSTKAARFAGRADINTRHRPTPTEHRVRDTTPIAPMVIVSRNGRVNRIPQASENRCETSIPVIAQRCAP